MRALPHWAARTVAVAALAVFSGAVLSACGDDGPVAEARQTASSLIDDADVTLPDVTLPDMSVPDVTVPDVTMPDVTAPDVTTPDVTAAPTPAPVPAAEPESDDGLGPFGFALLALLIALVVAAIVALLRSGGDSTDGNVGERTQLGRNLDQLTDDANWTTRQAAEALRSTDLNRMAMAWSSARSHFLEIEQNAADIHPDSEALAGAIQQVGVAVAELRGSLDAYANAVRRGTIGQLDALGPLQEAVAGRQDNVAIRLQALASARNTYT